MNKPTALQLGYVRYIHAFIDKHGGCPSFRDIAKAMGCTLRNVWVVIEACRRNGILGGNKARTIRPTQYGLYLIGEPVCPVRMFRADRVAGWIKNNVITDTEARSA